MYKRISYKYSETLKELTGKNSVLPLFKIDINSCCKRVISIKKTRIIVFFPGEKYSCKYILPVCCKGYLEVNKP